MTKGLVIDGNWQTGLPPLIGLAIFVGGQRFFRLLSRPRAAIVRFRGPATPEFAWTAMTGSLVAALCMLAWAMRCTRWWLDAPVMLLVEPPPNDILLHVTDGVQLSKMVEAGYPADVRQGLACKGVQTDDPAAQQL